MGTIKTPLTLEEFLALPETDLNYELINGEAIAKIAPKRFYSRHSSFRYRDLQNDSANNFVSVLIDYLARQTQQQTVLIRKVIFLD